jgi:hypothetical protein
MSLTFGLQDANDMLAKLHHEHERLEREVTSYDLFNFVVTAYHLIEWVERDPVVPPTAKHDLASIRQDTYIAVCRDLANANKHFKLKRDYKGQVTSEATSKSGFGVGRYGAGAFGRGEESITIVLTDETEYVALALARSVIDVWDAFFARHKADKRSGAAL